MDHYLTVRRWEPDFKPYEAGEVATALWVRFPQLPIEYYNEKVLFHIAKAIGKPLKIDLNIAMSTRGRYARCGKVRHRKEYCSSKPVPKPVKVNTEAVANSHDVGSNPIPMANSSGKQLASGTEHSEEFGPWMLVNRRNNRPNLTGRQPGPSTINARRSANRFRPLAKNGSRKGTTDRAKHKNPMGPGMKGANGKESSSKAVLMQHKESLLIDNKMEDNSTKTRPQLVQHKQDLRILQLAPLLAWCKLQVMTLLL
ncbi:uncharacterized protein LOC114262941 [Camellia sinensis]|uniref:uncharacterized protein LOC114262941 n=1 Tax=Camellia sinensis TaxID=4442 RepID=UPI001035EDAB|nr:uncharacterized protein LOC114262941 [Camellia sinensis]